MLIETTLIATMTCGQDYFMRIVQNSTGEVIERRCVTEFWDCPAGTKMSSFQISVDDDKDDFYYCIPDGITDGNKDAAG